MLNRSCAKFIEYELPQILLQTDQFKDQKCIKWEVKESKTDFGFMSTIIDAKLVTTKNEIENVHYLIIKIMKENEDFRVKSQSYVQFQNEIFMYEKVLPFFNRYLQDKKIKFNANNWIPKTLVNMCLHQADGKLETILVQENIQYVNFRISSSLYLTEQHFNFMIDYLAQLHSVSLALKIRQDKEFANLIKQLTPLCFEDPSGEPCWFDVLYEIATTRLFDNVFGKRCHNETDTKFFKDVERLQEVVKEIGPVKLLEKFREIDKFAVIVHGDYNRNNLMFKYDDSGCVQDMRMIDFQLLRYGSPCLDLAFLMYLNIDPVQRSNLWNQLLKDYHRKLLSYTADILNTSPNDSLFENYNETDFMEHCKKFFLYGTLISVSYTPWLLTTKEETAKVAALFQANMFDEKYRAFALVVGGETANKRTVGDMKHASEMGYLDMLQEFET